MRFTTVSAFALLSTVLATYGCATDSAANETAASSQDIVSEGGARVCRGAFFDAHPVVATATDSQGFVMPVPLGACDAETTVIGGLSDYAGVARRLEGTGYEPMKFQGGKAATLVNIADYKMSDLGAYTEFFLLYPVLKSGTENPEVPVVNGFSALIPTFLPQTEFFVDTLILQKGAGDLAIRGGIEHLGLDKRAGNVTVSYAGDATSIDITDEHDASVVRGTFRLDLSQAGQYAAANEFAQAFGLPDATYLPPVPDELVWPVVSKDVRRPGSTFLWRSTFGKLVSAFGSFGADDTFSVGTGELGAALTNMGFTPTVVTRYYDTDVVFTPGR